MKHVISLALAALLTWAFLAVLGPVSNVVARYWLTLEPGQQTTVKIMMPFLLALPAIIIAIRRRKARPQK